MKYALPDFYIEADQGSDLIIINPQPVKKLRFKVKQISTFANYCFGMFVANEDSTELKSWIKFWGEDYGI